MIKTKIIFILSILSIAAGGFMVPCRALQITVNTYEDSSPHIKNNYVVWQGYVESDWEIFLYDIKTNETVQITDNSYGDISPRTDGKYVVWLGFSNAGGEIFLFDILNQVTTQITNDTRVDASPQITKGQVAWSSQPVTDSVGPGEIFLYKTATQQTIQLTSDTLDDSCRGINKEHILWIQKSGTGTTQFLYDLTSGISSEAPQGFIWPDSDQRDGNLTVYSRVENGDREIFVRYTSQSGLQTYHQISDNDVVDKYPKISRNKIAWVTGEGAAAEIFIASYGSRINRLKKRECDPGEVLPIIGNGFGETQGNSVVHINNKVYDAGSPRIKLWGDTKIKIKIPNFKCDWFKGQDYRRRKVWVTVDGIDSNLKKFKAMQPTGCP